MRRVWARALTLTLIFNMSLLFPTEVRAARYVDLPGNWAERYVNQLSDEGVIPAEKDGKFRPDDPVTRGVFSFWLINTLGIKDQAVPTTPSFSDVQPSDWYYKSVELVKENSYIAGYPDGFRPNQFIQRGEVIVIMSRTLSTPDPDEKAVSKELAKYKDGAKVPDWARVGVAKASLAGIKIGYQDQKDEDAGKPKEIRAATLASRADSAALLFALDDYKTQKSIADATNRAEQGLPPVASTQNRAPQLASQQPRMGQQPSMQQQPGMQQQSGMQQQQPMDRPPQYGQQQMPGQQAAGYPVSAPFVPYNAGPPLGQPAMAQNYGGQFQTPGGYPPQQYQGQPQAPGAYGGQANGGGYAAPPQQQGGYGGYPPQQQGQYGGYPPPSYLQGSVAIVSAGTEFHASLVNTLDSGSTQPGEQVQATLSEPLYANGREVIPAGSKIIGQVTNVVSAKRFRFGANGRIDLRFTSIETPDGRRFPLSASLNQNQVKLTGGTTKGRVGKTLMYTGGGALGGAALGTGLGAITGGLSHGGVGMSTGMGAAFGSAMGGVVGLGVGAIRKGGEVKLTAGEALPIRLDESLQLAGGGPQPMQQQQYGGGYGGGGGGYAPPVQQPAGGYYPQQQ